MPEFNLYITSLTSAPQSIGLSLDKAPKMVFPTVMVCFGLKSGKVSRVSTASSFARMVKVGAMALKAVVPKVLSNAKERESSRSHNLLENSEPKLLISPLFLLLNKEHNIESMKARK